MQTYIAINVTVYIAVASKGLCTNPSNNEPVLQVLKQVVNLSCCCHMVTFLVIRKVIFRSTGFGLLYQLGESRFCVLLPN